jgi:hypothetical protein
MPLDDLSYSAAFLLVNAKASPFLLGGPSDLKWSLFLPMA